MAAPGPFKEVANDRSTIARRAATGRTATVDDETEYGQFRTVERAPQTGPSRAAILLPQGWVYAGWTVPERSKPALPPCEA
jgi:hypothetical protein